jgi:hypothetical protein
MAMSYSFLEEYLEADKFCPKTIYIGVRSCLTVRHALNK